MKISKSIFGKEDNDIEKFNELDLDERSIVFYSESSVILYPYVEEIIRELQNRDQKVCYLTSSKDDPILKNKNENVRVFYIGDSELEKMNFFLRLKAKILIMTMPDLGSFHIKRSKEFPVHYIYTFHSMNSTHMEFQKGAFDEFDSIFCVGPYQVQELRATEQLYNLKRKNLVECGYGLLDKLLKLRSSFPEKKNLLKNNKKNILIAPSWGKQNLLESTGIELVKTLLDAGYHVTVRPHPMSIKKTPKIIKKIREKFDENTDFILESIRRINPNWGKGSDISYLISIIEMLKERAKSLTEFITQSHYFFHAPESYDTAGLKRGWPDENVNNRVEDIQSVLNEISIFWNSLENPHIFVFLLGSVYIFKPRRYENLEK